MKIKTTKTAAQPRSLRTSRRLAAVAAALAITAAVSGCGSDSGSSSATSGALTSIAATNASASAADGTVSSGDADTAAAPITDTNQDTGQAQQPGGQGGGSGGMGKNVDASTITTVDELNALINEAYGDGGLGLHRGHQPVEQVLIDTLGISHDEMHVRMDAGQNLSAIAEDVGVGTQTLIDTLVANWQPAIDNVESEGLIDADQAAQYHEALVDAFTFKVTWNGTDTAPTFTGV